MDRFFARPSEWRHCGSVSGCVTRRGVLAESFAITAKDSVSPLPTGALAAVNVQDFSGDERRRIQEDDSAGNFARFAHAAQGM